VLGGKNYSHGEKIIAFLADIYAIERSLSHDQVNYEGYEGPYQPLVQAYFPLRLFDLQHETGDRLEKI